MTPLDRAMERFGGEELWRGLQSIELRLLELRGPLMRLKGYGKTHPKAGLVRVRPHERSAEFEGLGRFEAGNVDGQPGYRDAFAGLRKHRRWSAADATYFFGYAITTYLSIPFVLRDLKTETRERGDGGFEIIAEFPDGFDTHSEKQRFSFDREGLLFRHDYRADIVGRFAYGAHFTSGYVTIGGLPIATRRDVYVRLGRWATPIPVLSAELEPLAVQRA